jgi:uncharacterized membrane protein
MRIRIAGALGTATAAGISFALLSTVSGTIRNVADFVLWRVTLPRAFLFLFAVAVAAGITSAHDFHWRRRPTYRLSSRGAAVVLGLIVGVAAAVWRAIGSDVTLPRVLGDELIYANLAKSVARGDGFLLRGAEKLGYGPGYPSFAAPFYALTDNGVAGFEALQVGQALVMASAAVPVYLLARRAMGREASLLCGAFAVASPALIFTSLVMTEALFYPVALWFCVVAANALDRPTLARQLTALALLVLATSIRLQAGIAVGALVTAVLLRAGTGGRRRELRRWAPTFGLFILIGVAWLTLSLTTDVQPLGAYSVLTHPPDIGSVVTWSVRSLGTLAIAVGFVALIVFPPAAERLLRGSSREASLGALAISMLLWIVLQVGYFSATPSGLDRVHERNLIVLVPLVVIVAMSSAISRKLHPVALTTLGAVATIVGVASIRHEDFVRHTDIDSLSLVPWGSFGNALLRIEWVAIAAAVVATIVAWSTHRAWVVTLTVVVAFAVSAYIPARTVGRENTQALTWVDDELGRSADVLVLTAGITDDHCTTETLDELATWTEFFNISAVRAAHLFQENTHTNLVSEPLDLRRDGRLQRSGAAVTADGVVVDERVVLNGQRLVTLRASTVDPSLTGTAALSLWRLDGPARVLNAQALGALRHRAECS